MYVLGQYDKKKYDAGPKSGRQFALDVFSGIIITCWF